MQNLKETVKEFNGLVVNQKWEEGLNKFYAENIVSVDHEGELLKGLQTMKNGLEDFTANISDVALTLKNVLLSYDLPVTG